MTSLRVWRPASAVQDRNVGLEVSLKADDAGRAIAGPSCPCA